MTHCQLFYNDVGFPILCNYPVWTDPHENPHVIKSRPTGSRSKFVGFTENVFAYPSAQHKINYTVHSPELTTNETLSPILHQKYERLELRLRNVRTTSLGHPITFDSVVNPNNCRVGFYVLWTLTNDKVCRFHISSVCVNSNISYCIGRIVSFDERFLFISY